MENWICKKKINENLKIEKFSKRNLKFCVFIIRFDIDIEKIICIKCRIEKNI